MSERGKLWRRLIFAVPAGLLATLVVFAAMEYLATMGEPSESDLDRYVKASRIKESEDPKPPLPIGEPVRPDSAEAFYREKELLQITVCRCVAPPLPSFKSPFPSRSDRQRIPHDPRAVRMLLAEPDRPRSSNWILLKGARPRYPVEAFRRGETGYAVVEFIITEKGRTAGIQVVEHSDPEFARAARRTVRDWLFIPRRENGRPVQSETVRLRIEFRMKE